LKIILIVIFFCFHIIGSFCGTVDPAYATTMLINGDGTSAVGGSCSTQTAVTILASTDDHSEIIYDEYAQLGQSFLATESVTLYSIIVMMSTKNGTPVLTARIGAAGSNDLSTTYTATDAHNATEDTGVEVELVFPSESRPTITSGQTYYVGIGNSGVYANRCDLAIDLASAYSNGAYYWTNSATDWVLDTTYNADLYLKYKKCN
jgi:hypothetical protein